ncbi:MAG: FAD-binding oxidoreductase [Firmicutes bacterium]|nr:FAD-binding oxidoreductase [Bacillota bacterium]
MKANQVIIGAGISGCSIAYHLAKKGMKNIVVVDKSYLTSGATGRCGAGIRQQWGTEANCILAKKSIEFFETAKEELEYEGDIEFKQEGYLILATDKPELDRFSKNVKLQNSLGIPAKLLSVEESLKIVPYLNTSAFVGATFCQTDGHLNPFKMTEAFYLAAKRLGVQFFFFEEVKEIIVENNKITKVITDKHEIDTSVVVNAAGGFAKEIGDMVGIDIPVFSENHEILVTEPIEKIQGPMLMSFTQNFYCQQVPHGSFLMGRSTPNQVHSHDISSSWSFLDEMAKTICHIAPKIGELRVIRQWGGSYNVSPDKQPIIAEAENLKGFYIACGFSGHGFMFSPMTGEIISNMILNRKNEISPDLFKLNRFSEKELNAVEQSVV